MFEYLLFPAAIAVAAFMPKGKQNDRKKIEIIFKNVGYGVRKESKDGTSRLDVPKYKSKEKILDGEKEIGTTYKFRIPLGLPATKMAKLEKDIKVFTDGLGKPVEVDFKGTLNVHVYDEEIPAFFPYSELPSQPEPWSVPLGRSVSGMLWWNPDRIPHMTVAGTTRFGKTVMLRMMMTWLILNHPDDVEFYIIDLKGGLEFGRYEKLKQVKGVAADPFEAAEMLQGIHEMMQRDYVFFRKHNISNIVETDIPTRRFVIVDEGAQLAPEKWMKKEMKDMLGMCQYYLGEITRIGGSLGYREIFCTQYPTSDVLVRSIKQNSDAKISFRLPSGYASGVAIDDYGAEELPSDVKGRALFKTHELKELQVPYISHDEMWGRLEKYQDTVIWEGKGDVVEHREEEQPQGSDLIKFG